jgi:hypothetical protein
MMTWFANFLIVIGLWQVGGRRRSAFMFTFAGEAIWTVVSLYGGMYDLAAICALFSVLAARNWCKWGSA